MYDQTHIPSDDHQLESPAVNTIASKLEEEEGSDY